ncbi:hypothetical protein GCM10027277_23830 [Pseudoduganella ginsengisoli]|uniref:Uncharacterized protein n=1 Tax=Pseudoduganella ginsengisoli TaxID=1462440 RepID=A0A6L6Q0E2_9BURK|nr:hypothetical protein [Pseudoduganella ginsengisoli]MTW02894.1 hypothetical protein [Pseudoduganella ginsengisoli]
MSVASHPRSLITKGFWLAGAYNVFGMLTFSKLFMNPLLAAVDPAVFSWLGQVAVVLWGLAYWAVAKTYHHVPALLAVFAFEKLVYVLAWLRWLSDKAQTLPSIASESPLTAMFFSVYGAGDLVFGLFFAWTAWHVGKAR